MNLSRNLLRSVIFVDRDGAEPFNPKGTAFLVKFESCTYLVTARHVAEQLQGEKFRVRVNKLDGGADVITVELAFLDSTWRFFAGDDTVDLAVLFFDCRLNPKLYEVAHIPADMFATGSLVKLWGIGLAETCYAVGLFGRAPGETRNMPVVHTGNIASLPEGKNIRIATSGGVSVMTNAYLVSAANLEGLSGAPVLVRPSVVLGGHEANDRRLMAFSESVFLLGVWQASWTAEPPARGSRVPVGMGIVVPTDRLVELLSSELVVDERLAAEALLDERLARFHSVDAFFESRPGLTVQPA